MTNFVVFADYLCFHDSLRKLFELDCFGLLNVSVCLHVRSDNEKCKMNLCKAQETPLKLKLNKLARNKFHEKKLYENSMDRLPTASQPQWRNRLAPRTYMTDAEILYEEVVSSSITWSTILKHGFTFKYIHKVMDGCNKRSHKFSKRL